jgi:hypothetical protein
MSKLGYKQKGISMLKSPLNIDGVTGVTGVGGKLPDLVAKGRAGKKKREDKAAKTASDRATTMDEILTPFKSGKAAGYNSYRNRRKEVLGLKKEVFSNTTLKNDGSSNRFNELSRFQKPKNAYNDISVDGVQVGDELNPPPPPKGGRSFKDAYAKRDMDTYGSLSQSEFTAEAKRQLKGGKVPGSQMRGSSNKSVNAGIKGPNTEEVAKAKSKLSQLGYNPKGQTITAGKVTKKDILDAKSAKSMSKKAIKGQKEASKKEGKMSRKEIRLQKLNSKAASTKRSTNKTIKSIDSKKAESADTKAKQTSAKSSRAISIDKKARLEKKAGKLKSRIEVQKNNKANREANKKIRKNR